MRVHSALITPTTTAPTGAEPPRAAATATMADRRHTVLEYQHTTLSHRFAQLQPTPRTASRDAPRPSDPARAGGLPADRAWSATPTAHPRPAQAPTWSAIHPTIQATAPRMNYMLPPTPGPLAGAGPPTYMDASTRSMWHNEMMNVSQAVQAWHDTWTARRELDQQRLDLERTRIEMKREHTDTARRRQADRDAEITITIAPFEFDRLGEPLELFLNRFEATTALLDNAARGAALLRAAPWLPAERAMFDKALEGHPTSIAYDYRALRQVLRGTFHETLVHERILQQAMSFARDPDQTLTDYLSEGSRLNEAACDVIMQMDRGEIYTLLQRMTVMRGLPRHMLHALLMNGRDYDNLPVERLEQDAALLDAESSERPCSPSSWSDDPLESYHPESDPDDAASIILQDDVPTPPGTPPRHARGCFSCGSTAHIRRNCPDLTMTVPTRPSTSVAAPY